MMPVEITKDEILAVYPKVAQIMADALGCDVEQVELGVPLIEGLNAESIDFLDIVFRLERGFKVKIPRGKVVEDARGDLPEAAFEQKGYVTAVGLERLREYLSEVPADRFRSPMKVADIPRLFTPETFCKVVVRALRAVPGDASRGRGSEGTGAPKTDG
jgi:acyl carrier protein